MSKKKILVFIDWYLPGFRAGGPIRSCSNLISHLSDEFDFFVVTRNTDYMNSFPYKSVKKDEWNKLPDGSNVFYISKDNLTVSAIKKIIKEINSDTVYLNGIYSWYFTILPLLILNKNETRVIVAARGMLAPSALAIKSFRKRVFLFLSKIFNLFNNVTFHATKGEEKQQIINIFPKAQISIAPNLSGRISDGRTARINKLHGQVRLINIARISPEKNLLFALKVLRDVKEKVIFDFFGPVYDNNYWEQCKKFIYRLPSNITANYKGIADGGQIFQVIKNYHFMFLPSRGENFGHIILEALSAGVPVIISDKTPWRNLEGRKAGWDISLNDTIIYSKLIEKCVLMDDYEYEKYSNGAFAFASEYAHDEGNVQMNRQLLNPV